MTKLSSLLTILMLMIMISILYLIILNNLHPIFLIIFMMMYTLIICLLMSYWNYNYLFSIMLFLIMISGLLILFLYFASLISNEQNKILWRPLILINVLLNFILSTMIFQSNYNTFMTKSTYIYNSLESLTLLSLNNNSFQNIIKIFLYPSNILTLTSMFYLLFALFAIIKICSSKTSALRKII